MCIFVKFIILFIPSQKLALFERKIFICFSNRDEIEFYIRHWNELRVHFFRIDLQKIDSLRSNFWLDQFKIDSKLDLFQRIVHPNFGFANSFVNDDGQHLSCVLKVAVSTYFDSYCELKTREISPTFRIYLFIVLLSTIFFSYHKMNNKIQHYFQREKGYP